MELMEALRTRRSVRRYAPVPVERATIERLLEAAIRAPSAMNSQPWAFGIIEGVEILRGYSDRVKTEWLSLIDKNPSLAHYRVRMSNPAYNVFHDAPVLVCLYAKPVAGPFPRTDCALAAQSLMLAAHDQGLATCWIGFAQWLFKKPEMSQELGVPEEYVPVGQLALGYPQGELPSPTPRKAPETLFWKSPLHLASAPSL